MAKEGLVIVESPAKAKTIGKYLGSEFIVEASIGHVKDLPKRPRDKSKLGIDIDRNYKPRYVVIPGKKEVLEKLRELARKVNKVFIATDPDREGEAIAWHIKTEIESVNSNIKRVLFTEITRNGIEKGMQNPRDIDMNLVDAQQARRVLDRIVGYRISPFLKKVVNEKISLSAGRVQSVALRLVCEREEEIKNFKPEEYWTIEAEFKTQSGEILKAKLFKINGEDPKIPNRETAEKILDDLKDKVFRISNIQKKEILKNPAPPFITSTLQQEASNKLRFSAKKTMMLAQQLYEGVELGDEGRVGLITYMRTDSTRLSDESVNAVREYIYNNYGKEYLPQTPRVFKKSKTSQDAHEAIRPTYMKYEPKFVKKYLDEDLFALYELIWNRFVACQMSSAVLEQTVVDITADGYLFRATGTIVKFNGYMQIYEETKTESEDKEEKEVKIPVKINIDEILALTNLVPEQHFTKPPARYTEASLVKELESRGIGRPSTYATIISTILERGYVELQDRKLIPTDLGFAVNKILISNFPDVVDYKFTARMEDDLDEIASGKKKYTDVVDSFFKPFDRYLKELENKKDEIREQVQEKTDIACYKCGSKMVVKIDKYGKYLACSNLECNYTMAFPTDGELGQVRVCPECGGRLVLRHGRFGKFYGCENYPSCKYTESITTGIKCPECGKGELVERKSKRKRTFYGCSNYPDCGFILWDKPIEKPCPECGYPLIVKPKRKTSTSYKCPKCNAEIMEHSV
ncbi:type I DNA topoisomerase [Candidatus Kryptobacter tengchongensis]|uniref:type I DNA topoisomerase n=1 Tax=Kryptobacter tengchongensis TaxID=1643429 RepID=UPI0007081CA7|nr:type I DNA topoisomerase [Candidatus Kryptobacter tengchongensis]CUS82852.1 DNA topoisomerase-1 [Candidatus Kryptobacter tengchongensis]